MRISSLMRTQRRCNLISGVMTERNSARTPREALNLLVDALGSQSAAARISASGANTCPICWVAAGRFPAGLQRLSGSKSVWCLSQSKDARYLVACKMCRRHDAHARQRMIAPCSEPATAGFNYLRTLGVMGSSKSRETGAERVSDRNPKGGDRPGVSRGAWLRAQHESAAPALPGRRPTAVNSVKRQSATSVDQQQIRRASLPFPFG